MAEPASRRPEIEERAAYRCARFMARYGAPGAILAFLILRTTAVAPLALANIKALKALPVLLFCCYEVTWLFGWIAGALIIAQYGVHEWAHAAAARAQGRAPGWYALIPLAGPYMSTAGAPWRTREAEARVALEGQLAGLLFAGALYLLGVAFASPMLHKAALIGFLFNLVQLVPLRPFDGGRLFPGLDWPATRDEDVSARLWLSLAFERLVRRIGCRIGLDDASRPAALRSLIGPALFTIMLAGFAAVAVVAVLLPPKAIALAILLWVAGTLALILFVLCLDPRVLRSGDERLLAPRRPLEPQPEAHCGPVPWSSRTKTRCALLAYLLLLAAHALGALASWTA